jgi:hypothetical protein
MSNVSKFTSTEDERYFSPAQLTQRWPFHVESIRRKIRRGEIGSVVIGRKRLIALSEIKRIEAEGRITPTFPSKHPQHGHKDRIA